MQTYEKAVISLDLVFKLEVNGGGGESREQKGRAEATIVDPSGLAVTSLSTLERKGTAIAGGRPVPVVGTVQEAKYHLADGTEIPARIVLKDEDTDLAFLAPLKPLDAETKAKITTISMSDAAAAPELLDPTIIIKRADDAHDYIPMLDLGFISGFLSKPRSCYTTNKMTNGIAVFDKQGKVLGVFVVLMEKIPVLLPAADVAKLVPQALDEAKKPAAEEKSSAEEKKE